MWTISQIAGVKSSNTNLEYVEQHKKLFSHKNIMLHNGHRGKVVCTPFPRRQVQKCALPLFNPKSTRLCRADSGTANIFKTIIAFDLMCTFERMKRNILATKDKQFVVERHIMEGRGRNQGLSILNETCAFFFQGCKIDTNNRVRQQNETMLCFIQLLAEKC